MVRSIKNPKKAKRKNKKGDGSSSSSSVPSMPTKVWQPGVDNLEEGEELECDPTAYNCLHAFHIGWPCLSFDVVRDSLGLLRTDFPHTVYFVAGTQAENPDWNSIGIFKVSNVSGKRRELVPTKATTSDFDMDADNSNSDSDEDSEDEEEGGICSTDFTGNILPCCLRKVAHSGCVNRIRAMTQNPHICASWSDAGYVQGGSLVFNQDPIFNFKGHKDEGYAIDWSPRVTGRLVTGDCNSCIRLWEPTSGATWNVDATLFTGYTASVEDLQWSPTEDHVFASCSVDGHIAIWDARLGKSPAILSRHIMQMLASVMLASGSDDGTFSIRDLRLLSTKSEEDKSLVAHFEYHKHPITSIEWSPHEASTLANMGSFSEKDEEEEAEFKAKTKEQVNAPADLPPQLLFVHQGQKDLKELHWDAQIPGMIVSTASDGFNILMPSNIQSTLPSEGA
ncbi:glutamate-rich WD repeat-containing protein [Salix suchowensis]|nr:glutamate-rich WD repeat-containing protein [Salix suchowensis]